MASILHERSLQIQERSLQVLLADLKQCCRTKDLDRGKQVHAEAVQLKYNSSAYVVCGLISMYAKCGSMVCARQVFDSTKHPTVFSWNALILGYADNGQGLTALKLFTRMKSSGPAPDTATFVAVLKACTSCSRRAEALQCGKQVHNVAVEEACDGESHVQNTLINMYSRCRSMAEARQVFQSMWQPDVVSWTTLILGYTDNGQGLAALSLFSRMNSEGPAPNSVTFMAALRACISLALKERMAICSDRGEEVHNLAVEMAWDSDIFVQSTLIDMYGKYGRMESARHVFESMKEPNRVAWNSLILGYADNGQGLTALDMFMKMKDRGPTPDSVTFVAALKACTSLAVKGASECKDRGKQIHNLAVKDSDVYVHSTLINLYAKCGSMSDARQVFESIQDPDVVSLNALIMGYADNGQGLAALGLFVRMRLEGPAPNAVTRSAALKACALLGALECGKTIHAEIVDRDGDLDVVLVTCLVDFYAKCGNLVDAQSVFDMHPETRDVVTWTALLAGFNSCGDYESVFKLFEGMQDASVRPNSVTFVCMLTCCSHAGLVQKGYECFDGMASKHGVVPSVEHYSCMADILGRANRLDDAMALVQGMPCSPDEVTWTTILDASRKWKNVEIGRLAFQFLASFKHAADAGSYVLMGQIYGSRGMLQEQEMVMALSRGRAKPEACRMNWKPVHSLGHVKGSYDFSRCS